MVGIGGGSWAGGPAGTCGLGPEASVGGGPGGTTPNKMKDRLVNQSINQYCILKTLLRFFDLHGNKNLIDHTVGSFK